MLSEHAEGVRFVRHLWGNLLPEGDMVPIVEIDGGVLRSHSMITPVALISLEGTSWQGDCYFSSCSVSARWQARKKRGSEQVYEQPRGRWAHPRTEDARRCPAFWLDIDPTGERIDPERVARALEIEGLASIATVYTGRGVHLWQPLTRPLLIDDPTGAALKRALRRHGDWVWSRLERHQLGGKPDAGVYNQAAKGRLPGSTNAKTGELVRVLTWGAPIGVDEIARTRTPPALPPPPRARQTRYGGAAQDDTAKAIEALRREGRPGNMNEVVARIARTLGGRGARLEPFLDVVRELSTDAKKAKQHTDTARRFYRFGTRLPLGTP